MTDRPTGSRRPTIKEVARLAGVSHQTVSRYLRSRNGLKPATLARIDAAVRELNYRPNLVARSMRTRRTGRLAVLLPTMFYNPARMLYGATEAAHEAGFTVEAISVVGDTAARTERMLCFRSRPRSPGGATSAASPRDHSASSDSGSVSSCRAITSSPSPGDPAATPDAAGRYGAASPFAAQWLRAPDWPAPC
jgi:transcriptional regulator with XRE-family HTH domain